MSTKFHFPILLFIPALVLGFWLVPKSEDTPPQTNPSLFKPYTKTIDPSILKTDVFEAENSIARHFLTFDYAAFKQLVMTPASKGQKPKVDFPLVKGKGVFTATTINYEAKDGLHTWEGEFGSAEVYSHALMVVREGGGFGQFQIDDRIFSFHPLALEKENKIVLVMDEVVQPKNETCDSEEPKAPQVQVQAQNTQTYPIHVLYVFPDNFRWVCNSYGVGLIGQFQRQVRNMVVRLYTAHLNREYRQLGITEPISFSGTHMCSDYRIVFTGPSDNFNNEVDDIKANVEISRKRDEVEADIVVLLSPRAAGTSVGKTQTPWTPGLRWQHEAYGVVSVPHAISNFTLAHELGHMMSLHHERADTEPDKLDRCQYAYYIKVARAGGDINRPFIRYRTIMAIGEQAQQEGGNSPVRVGWFSTGQDVGQGGVRIRFGISCNANPAMVFEGPANNTKMLNVSAPIVATYR
ncbi:MAG: reprolysin-like metallopeptidase [Bacteroidota bacterium]